ncbi:MAG: DNA polymerase III subunit [Chloroflexota bacterium]|nr:DNA polymerase III subunit [Chloroflexota bacterium]
MDDDFAMAGSWAVIGHDWAIDMLRGSLLKGRQRHAYLIAGAPSLGKRSLALAFARALNCEAADIAARPCGQCRACRAISRANDPDLIVAKGVEGAPLKIDEIREVTRLLALKPYAARYRIAILADFDRVAPLAQDSLLKTLEEPAEHAVLIVLASSSERVLPTIRSRAQTIPLRPAPLGLVKAALIERGCEEARADLIARLSGGRTGWALAAMRDDEPLAFRAEMLDKLRDVVAGGRLARIKLAEELNKRFGRDKKAVRGILEIWLSYWRDVLLQCYESPVKPCNGDRAADIDALATGIEPSGARAALEATSRTIDALTTNANVRLALDALFLDYPGLE